MKHLIHKKLSVNPKFIGFLTRLAQNMRSVSISTEKVFCEANEQKKNPAEEIWYSDCISKFSNTLLNKQITSYVKVENDRNIPKPYNV